ncbi:unnamed protein product [Lepeophtheirus salmonis]|uniref:(salmon louse) hypothetical protein n=1 Tax=Lepeophtheirus salmonis TaxID=72036 RepID=A0A7R8D4C2_LEPSM|nr:unnamed protein product [Lepeophtheirus salmonis]CAF2992882.1 unnamed protein product [Lepeophtheirus salmonis]
MDPLLKFSYLKICLKGEPLGKVVSLPINKKGYDEAMKLLEYFYGRSRLVINKLIHEFIESPPCKNNYRDLGQLCDSGASIQRCLEINNVIIDEGNTRNPFFFIVMFDEGSQISLISSNIEITLKSQDVEKRCAMIDVNNMETSAKNHHRHEISFRSIDNSLISVSAFEVHRISYYNEHLPVDLFKFPHLKGIHCLAC